MKYKKQAPLPKVPGPASFGLRTWHFWKGYLFFISVFVFFSCTRGEAGKVAEDDSLKAAATIFPIADMVREVGGGRVQVITILPPGANPHTFELTPGAIKDLEGVKVLLMIGRGFDDWVKVIGESLPQVKMIAVDEGIDLVPSTAGDPHYWLSIANAKMIAKTIAEVLSEADSGGAEEYQANLNRYLSKLGECDRKIRDLLADLPARKIITFHDGWRYFARAYDLEILGTVEPSPGQEPTPRQLAELHDGVSNDRIRVLFSEPAVSKIVAESLAGDLDLRLYELDPIGTEGVTSYLGVMLRNAEIIHGALTYESPDDSRS